ncbi:MAG: hypothetical protein ACXWUB_02715, partial [Burkholderiales bacterium]
TYSWLANHLARIDPLTPLHAPSAIRLNPMGRTVEDYPVRSTPEPGFDADYVSISKSFGRDSSPVPVGTIMLWPNAEPKVPMGWAICNGDHGTPDLSGQFPPLLVYIRKLGY